MSPYIFDNAAEAETAERFASLDALYNFRTFRFLETAGIRPGWHCLEVGGGNGSVAAWMADRAGPSGYVLVTDIDPRFMEGSAYRRRRIWSCAAMTSAPTRFPSRRSISSTPGSC